MMTIEIIKTIIIGVIIGITILALLIMLGKEVDAECEYKYALTKKIEEEMFNEKYERRYKNK